MLSAMVFRSGLDSVSLSASLKNGPPKQFESLFFVPLDVGQPKASEPSGSRSEKELNQASSNKSEVQPR